ncbi:hypothetical protein Pyn_06494 [Prunus yedoensis var. nudiflora]|uniref:Uncharacterized protein n=1 Tax=Prunus yedoensis var. nudiflora TaxID=2094558 RepID=A0A314ZXG8_PRUYE|nr:hypothetical protein Pyn_06494 [Prunus yedoensis var. nudiflora]
MEVRRHLLLPFIFELELTEEREEWAKSFTRWVFLLCSWISYGPCYDPWLITWELWYGWSSTLGFAGDVGLGFVHNFEAAGVFPSSGLHAFVQLLEVCYSFFGLSNYRGFS